MDVPTFRTQFPEFASAVTYPDAQVLFWINLAVSMLSVDRWGTTLDYGIALFTAHHLVLQARDVQASAAGGVPGAITGPQSSKSVDKVSVSYDTGSISLENAGFWGMTSYGIRFLQFARYMGAGGIQL